MFRLAALFLFLSVLSCGAQEFVLKEIIFIGNRVTRPELLEREIFLKKNERYTARQVDSLIAKSVDNLNRLLLFNRVDLQAVFTENENFYLRAEVAERWYWWPRIFFEVAEPNFNIWWQDKNFRRANYGAELYKQNFRGRNESLFLSFKYGFSNQFRVYYRKPWLSAGSNFGISVETTYAEQGEVNIGTTDHVRDFFGRPGERVQIERLASFGVSYRPRLRTWGEVVFGFVNLTTTGELVEAAPDYFNNGTGHLRYLRAAARFRHDDRDNPGYPLEGLMFEALLTQRGFGLLPGESIDQTQIQLDHRHHIPLAGRWYAAYTAHLKFNLRGRIPYVVQRGLGYNDLVRGFELRVIDGQHYGLLSGNVKYALIPKKHVKFGERIPALTDAHYALYWTLFSDVAYARDDFYAHRNPLANTWLASFGTGLDFSTYYDTVIRGELSLNSLGEPGYFMHFRKVF